ncbi:MAG: ABC transporter permease [Flavobacteriales bacterium]
MIRYHLLLTLRHLARNKVYTVINVLGLAIGLACFTLITAYVADERSFETFAPQYSRIYRVVGDLKLEGQGERSSSCVFGLGPTLLHDHPELIDTYARFFDLQEPSLAFRVDDHRYNEQDVYLTDSTVFDLFGYTLIEGDPKRALAAPNSIVITAEMGRRYFGDVPAMGRMIRWDGQVDLQVTGILGPVPKNSHIRFDALVSIYTMTQGKWQGIEQHNWVWNPCWTYIRLKDGVTAQEVQRVFPDFIQKYYPEFLRTQVHHDLQPLTAIHLTSDLDYEMAPNAQAGTVNVLWVIGVFILLIALVNYMNLATAQSVARAREVGVRKTTGARRGQLITQFLAGSAVMGVLAGVLAILLTAVLLPWFNSIAEKAFALNAVWVLRILACALVAGLLAGLYPAFFLSSFKPAWVMKGSSAGSMQGRTLRKVLVVLQFAVALALIIATVFVRRQFEALRTADLGFTKEHVLVLRARASMDFLQPLLNTLQNMSGVKAVGFANDIIGKAHNAHELNYDGMPADQWKYYPALMTGYGLKEVLDLQLVAGRWYDRSMPREDSLSVVINERMVKELGWGTPEDALGRRLNTPSGNEHVIGVVKDFHFDPLFKPVGPFFFDMCRPQEMPVWFRCIYVRLAAGDQQATIDAIGRCWRELTQEFPFEFTFLDGELDGQYRSQGTLATLITGFAVLAVVIACLGLYALAAFSTEKRTREIGIRKVLGAGAFHITGLVTREFLVLVLLANVLAWPLAFYGVHRWLEGFSVRTAIDPLVFLAAALTVLLIAALTVAWKATRAARIDPVKALRTA